MGERTIDSPARLGAGEDPHPTPRPTQPAAALESRLSVAASIYLGPGDTWPWSQALWGLPMWALVRPTICVFW